MKTILVAVDGSEPSLKGVRTAVELSKALNARLELAYVIPPVLLPPSTYAETIKKLDEANALMAKEALDRARAVVQSLGAEADLIQLSGAPAESIADLSQAERVWGVVIGAKGHNALSRVMLGSTADRLMHLCTKPVLIVR
ncbi:MAG: universal stress protein [Myxococcaceae bacterium]|jgi:nucleotide-binding universal stress UspA family protein|nr:universal stress protein [Myxococcaceae bacterium]